MSIFKKLDKAYNEFVQERTVYYRDKLGFAPEETSTHNNKSDAFKHVLTSATLCLLVTPLESLLLTNKHEWNNLESGEPIEEAIMDFWNNKVGRQLGWTALGWLLTFRYNEEKLARAIVDKLNKGELICSLTCEHVEYAKNHPEVLFDRKCDLERFKKYLNGGNE